MPANYVNGKAAAIGDVVMAPGNVRGIVIAVQDSGFVTVLAIGTSKQTGDTFVLTPRYYHDFPAPDCHYMEPQLLNFPPAKAADFIHPDPASH